MFLPVTRVRNEDVFVGKMSGAVLQCPGYPEDKLRTLTEDLTCREAQAGTLLSLMGEVKHTQIHTYIHIHTYNTQPLLLVKSLKTECVLCVGSAGSVQLSVSVHLRPPSDRKESRRPHASHTAAGKSRDYSSDQTT